MTTNVKKKGQFVNIRNSDQKYIKLIGTIKSTDPLSGKKKETPYEYIYSRIGNSHRFALLPKAGSDVLNEYNPYSDGYIGCLSSGIYSNEVLEELFRINNFASPLSDFAVKQDQNDVVEEIIDAESISSYAKKDEVPLLGTSQDVPSTDVGLEPEDITEDYIRGLSGQEAIELYKDLKEQLAVAEEKNLCSLASRLKGAIDRILIGY